ncbi:uncharacterized protein LACBIDRAFT_327904 [Laccaria bicolor S238N-H82]|uniref:Predicted protein n=1 Tax=Laccaria bicolor (strain S238N-H82 / ATCC MYA-4686) TaxID=486041 RepID=B0DD62_LACBS|nr:uncharacterized protein LACBIDRAFT_327904 [Laccaria bicolor S238N-H82]EDR07423.1 predicted protein [Laccaria bicolor S238N-H82]|eukprot:XP_001881815.1 predicted protein [Laccaria bicolor S238N-H82]
MRSANHDGSVVNQTCCRFRYGGISLPNLSIPPAFFGENPSGVNGFGGAIYKRASFFVDDSRQPHLMNVRYGLIVSQTSRPYASCLLELEKRGERYARLETLQKQLQSNYRSIRQGGDSNKAERMS